MTIICAITNGTRTWIGSDRRATKVGKYVDDAEKWCACGPWWIGLCGTHRTFEIVQRNANKIGGCADPWDISIAIRELLREDRYKPGTKDGFPEMYEFEAIIAQPGRVWEVSDDFTVMAWPAGHLCAVGSGEQYARGAAFGKAVNGLYPQGEPFHYEDVMRTSIYAATTMHPSCGGEPWVMELT